MAPNRPTSRQGLIRLTRLAQRRPHAAIRIEEALAGRVEGLATTAMELAIETGDPIGRILAEQIREQASEALVDQLLERLDAFELDRSIPLTELLLEVTQIKWSKLRDRAALDATPVRHAELARLSCNLSIAQSNAGFLVAAEETARMGLRLYRKLAEAKGRRGDTDVAQALNILASILGSRERNEEALEHLREAIEIQRRLVTDEPEEWLELASSLNNLGGALFALGHHAEALDAMRESVAIGREWRSKFAIETLEDQGDLADNLDNLGTALQSCGHSLEALESTSEAVDRYRRLAAERPDVFLVDLARSLWNLAHILESLGRHREAAKAFTESDQLYDQLATERPELFGDEAPEYR